MLTEDHIIDAQKDVSVIVDDYEHAHVLRSIITPFDGTAFGSDLQQNQTVNNTFTATLPAEDGTWIAENMEVVVFVHRVDAGHKEVMQAFSAHLLAILLITATYGPEAFEIAQLFLSSWFGKMVLLGLTFSIYFHLANGIRHLGWDFGMGFNLPKVQATGIAVILFAIALTVLTWFAGYSVAGGF